MSHTNSTTNYGLPQFITTDKPAWLTDVNVAYNAIDTAMKNNQDAAAAARNDATQAISDAAAASSTASGADAKASGAIASISTTFSTSNTYSVHDKVIYNNLLYECIVAVSTPGAWTGSTNWSRIILTDIIPDNAEELIVSNVNPISVKAALDVLDAKASTNSVGITPSSGYTLIGYNNFMNDNAIALNFMFEKTGGGSWSTGWQAVGTVSVPPIGAVFAPLWNISQGAPNGMCRIDTDGTINLYVFTAGSVRHNVNITYRTS